MTCNMVVIKTLTWLVTLCVVQATSKNVNITNLNEHVKKMDAVLQELTSHSQAQEQKYSAVLSSVLSQLTQTTEELSASKNVTEELQLKYDSLEEELRDMMEINNNTLLDNRAVMDELTELKQSHNDTLLELTELKQSHNDTLLELTELKGQYQDIGFEANLDKAKTFSKSERIIFDKVSYNTGNGYSPITGFFTVPVSGTYLIWTNIVYKHVHSDIAFTITTANTILGNAYGNSDEPRGTASATTISYLKKGERVWIYPSLNVGLDTSYPSAGAVLIKHF